MIRKLLPRRLKRVLRTAHRSFQMRRAMRRIVANPVAAVDDDACLDSLIYGWGNEGWSAEKDYLRYMVRITAGVGEQQVLECGSGLSTLLLAATLAQSGGRLTTLENDPNWAHRVRTELQRYELTGVVAMHLAPLRSYEAFSWYSISESMGPFSVVVCDGPPSTTPGGRVGLMPVMRDRLTPGCRVLLDDVAREAEQQILRRWEMELRATYRVIGTDKPFAELTMPATRA